MPEDQQYSRYISEEAFYDFIICSEHIKVQKYKSIIYETLVQNKTFIKVLDEDKAKSIMSVQEERLRNLSKELDASLDDLFEYCKDGDENEVWDELDRQEDEKEKEFERKKRIDESTKKFMDTVGRAMWREAKYDPFDEFQN